MGPVPFFAGGVLSALVVGFLVQDGFVVLVGFVEVDTPGEGLVGGFYPGQHLCECVDGFAGIGAWSGGGLASDVALDVHGAALDAAGWPALFDGGVGSLPAVEGDN